MTCHNRPIRIVALNEIQRERDTDRLSIYSRPTLCRSVDLENVGVISWMQFVLFVEQYRPAVWHSVLSNVNTYVSMYKPNKCEARSLGANELWIVYKVCLINHAYQGVYNELEIGGDKVGKGGRYQLQVSNGEGYCCTELSEQLLWDIYV